MVHPELILKVEEGVHAGLAFRGGRKRRVTVGRTKASVFQIKETTVSEKHALLEWNGEHWVLQDVGSSNGTFHNGTGLSEHVPVNLTSGDVVLFGAHVKVNIQIGQEAVEKPKEKSRKPVEPAKVQVVVESKVRMQEAHEVEEKVQGVKMEEVAQPQLCLVNWLESERNRRRDRLSAGVQLTFVELKKHARELQLELCEYADLDIENLPLAL